MGSTAQPNGMYMPWRGFALASAGEERTLEILTVSADVGVNFRGEGMYICPSVGALAVTVGALGTTNSWGSTTARLYSRTPPSGGAGTLVGTDTQTLAVGVMSLFTFAAIAVQQYDCLIVTLQPTNTPGDTRGYVNYRYV